MLAYFLLKLSNINDGINLLRGWTENKIKKKLFLAPMTPTPTFTHKIVVYPITCQKSWDPFTSTKHKYK